jgi:glycogen debranching enzyme
MSRPVSDAAPSGATTVREDTASRERSARPEAPADDVVSMREAVGYPTIDCEHETKVEGGLVLKHDRYFLLLDAHGDLVPPGRCALGLFHDDTRILSHYALHVAGGPPSLLSTQSPTSYEAIVDLSVSDIPFGGNAWDPKSAVHVRREFLIADRMVERLTLTNYLITAIDYWVDLQLGADFADIFEVRGWKRAERGVYYRPEIERDSIVYRYRGRDGRLLRSRVCFQEPPDEIHAHGARWRFRLGSKERFSAEWEIRADEAEAGPRRYAPAALDHLRPPLATEYAHWRSTCSRWASDAEPLDRVIARAVDDLRALHVRIDGEEVISAGIPWYSTIFGRDSIIASIQTLPLNPAIALQTLRYLARHQGREENAFTEEQPGKILHELRRGEMARSGEIPHVPYYGSIDATPLWIVLFCEAWRWTGDEALVDELLPNAERALAWIDHYGDLDGDGFVEYARVSENGLVNQGWRDSGDGVPFPDGALPEPPIALVEVQGYVYDAKLRLAQLYDALERRDDAIRLRAQADALGRKIQQHFWLDALGTYALALDGRKRALPTATSNAGHLLWSRAAPLEQAARLCSHLLAPDMFCGWGIRTLSSRHAVFNPMSYHNGSVWPHDNGLIVLGLALNGFATQALPVVRGLYDAATHSDFERLPELFCGMPREYGAHPVQYPVSCSPQAWGSGTIFMLLQALLGILPEAPAGVLHIRNPVLPDFIDDLTVTSLAVGRSRVSLQFRRHGTRTLANLLAVDGAPLRVQIELD